MGGTAIDELDGGDLAEAGLGFTLAAALAACAALLLVLVPVAIAVFQPAVPPAWVGGVAGSLGAALGGVKLLAMAWGAGERLSRRHPANPSAALVD